MSEDRMAMYEGFVASEPENTMAWYVLAQERAKRDLFEAAIEAYRRVLEIDPAYVAAYYHGALTLQRAGRGEEARELLTRGLAVAREKGDMKSAGEIEELLQRP